MNVCMQVLMCISLSHTHIHFMQAEMVLVLCFSLTLDLACTINDYQIDDGNETEVIEAFAD